MAMFEYKNGRRATMSDRYGQILERLGKGRVVVDQPAKAKPIERKNLTAESDGKAKPKRHYRRKDMKAED